MDSNQYYKNGIDSATVAFADPSKAYPKEWVSKATDAFLAGYIITLSTLEANRDDSMVFSLALVNNVRELNANPQILKPYLRGPEWNDFLDEYNDTGE